MASQSTPVAQVKTGDLVRRKNDTWRVAGFSMTSHGSYAFSFRRDSDDKLDTDVYGPKARLTVVTETAPEPA